MGNTHCYSSVFITSSTSVYFGRSNSYICVPSNSRPAWFPSCWPWTCSPWSMTVIVYAARAGVMRPLWTSCRITGPTSMVAFMLPLLSCHVSALKTNTLIFNIILPRIQSDQLWIMLHYSVNSHNNHTTNMGVLRCGDLITTEVQSYGRSPIIWIPTIRIADYPNRFHKTKIIKNRNILQISKLWFCLRALFSYMQPAG